MYRRAPGTMLAGLIPALIVLAVYVVLLVVVVANLDAIAGLVDPLVAGLAPWLAETVRVLVGLAALGLTVVLVIVTFTAVTLAIGGPFYERIARRTETVLGNPVAPVESGFWAGVGRGLGETLLVLLLTVGAALLGVVMGLIPVAGQIAAPIVTTLFAGWFLALELTAFAFESRGLRLRDRRHVLGRRRARALGLGVACTLLFLIPGAAVALMPAAVAGATMLARDALASAAAEQAAAR